MTSEAMKMEAVKIIDLLKDEKPCDFENTGLILITNITEANIESAVKIAKSAESSQNVTAGILSCNINLLNYPDMRKFLDHADAVIQLLRDNNKYTARTITDLISDLITKTGFLNINIKAITETLKGAVTVYFVTGTAKSAVVATFKASEKFGNITNAKRFLLNITTGRKIALEAALGELVEVSRYIVRNSAPEAQVIWGYMIDEAMSENVRVSIFAAMNDKNSEA